MSDLGAPIWVKDVVGLGSTPRIKDVTDTVSALGKLKAEGLAGFGAPPESGN